jgi:hypothetical protein
MISLNIHGGLAGQQACLIIDVYEIGLYNYLDVDKWIIVT